METKLTLFNLFVALSPVVVLMFGGWVHMKTTISTLKSEIAHVQKDLKEEKEGNKESFKELGGKIDSLFGRMGEVRELILKQKING